MRKLWMLALVGLISGGFMIVSNVTRAERPDGPPPQDQGQQDQGPRDHGPGGPGGPGGGWHLLPRHVEDRMELSDDQKDQLDQLEKDVKAKLEKILTPEQMKMLNDMRPPHRDGQGGGPDGGGPGGQSGPGGQGGGQGGPGGGGQGGAQRGQRPHNGGH